MCDGFKFQLNFSSNKVVVTYPGASDFYVVTEGGYAGLKAGSTVAVEIKMGTLKDDGTVPFSVLLDGNAVINSDVGTAYGDYLGKAGSKVILSGGENLIIESSAKTCVHEKAEWTQPDENGAIFANCKHCNLLLESSYYAEIVDFAQVAGKTSAVYEGSGVIGDLGKTAFVGMASRIYLPNTGTYELSFSVMGDGERIATTGRYYGAFEFVFTNGAVTVKDESGNVLKSAGVSDLATGKTANVEFGVYALNEDDRVYFVKVNGVLILTDNVVTENAGIGSYCAYSFSVPTLMETSTATCAHVAGEANAPDGSGYVEIPCTNCGKVLYKDLEQTVYDISTFTGSDAYEITEQFIFDVNKTQCVGVKGFMYIPADAPSDFRIILTLMTDLTSYAWSGNNYRDGLYTMIISNSQVTITIPWAAQFFTFGGTTSSALKKGSTFAFEYGVYQVTDSPEIRYAYFKLNGQTVIEGKYYDQNFPLDTYFLIQTSTPIIVMKETECSGGVHKVGDWSEVGEDFIRTKSCTNCGNVLLEEEIASTVKFEANFKGMVTLADVEKTGESFTYNVPNVPGFKLKDIQANGVSVFSTAEELPNGYQVTIQRNALDIKVLAVYEEANFSVNYQYQKDATITVENAQVGYGGTAKFYIQVKNGKDVTSAKIGEVDYTDALEVTTGGYILTVDNVKENITLVLTMEKKQYAITIEDTLGGVLTSNKANVDAFGTVEITAKVADGYYLAYFLVNGEKTSSKDGVLTLTNISEDMTVSAVYVTLAETQTNTSNEGMFGCQSSIGGVGIAMTAFGAAFLTLRKKQKKENED